MIQHASKRRRWVSLAGSAAVIVALGATQVAAVRRAPQGRPTLTPATVENVASQTPSVSADGRLVVYAGAPSTADDHRTSTIWLKDRENGSVSELTAPSPDIRPGNSVWPVLSADGCSVTVITELGFDLFRDDDHGARWDVYRLLLPECGGQPGDWELVSSSGGTGFDVAAGDDVSPLYPPAVSGDGNIVAYTHQFSAAAPDLTGVTVVDLSIAVGESGRATPVDGAPAGAPDSTFRYHGLREPAISADGETVVYTSDANSSIAMPEWGTGKEAGDFATSNVFAWDRANLDRNTNVRRVSAAPGAPTGDSYSPAIAGDGKSIAFVSRATNLVPGAILPACNPECTAQVYLFDTVDGSLRLASRAAGDGTQPPVGADSDATQPALDRAGDELVYVTRAGNLFQTRSSAVGGPDDGDIVLFVPSTGEVDRVSVLADGVTPAPAANSHPQLSATGRVVVFDTLAGSAYGNPAVAGRQVAVVDRPPTLELSNLDVGTVAIGFPGPEWFLVVSNRGPSSFVPAEVTVSNPDFLVSGGSCADQATTPVPPGGSCTVNLMMMPSVGGDLIGTLTVSELGFDGASVSATVSGRGGDPSLAPTPGGGYGGSLVVGGRSEPLSFSLYNVAFNPEKITKLRLDGSNKDDFQISLDECTGKTIDAGNTCNLQVIFAPTGAGRRTANVVAITADGAYATILVSGDAHYEPKLAAGTTTVIANSRLTVAGSGFAPNTVVTISWADGTGRSTTVVTDAFGSLLATIIVRATDRPGNRTLIAQTADGQLAAADVQIIARTKHMGPGSPAWPSR